MSKKKLIDQRDPRHPHKPHIATWEIDGVQYSHVLDPIAVLSTGNVKNRGKQIVTGVVGTAVMAIAIGVGFMAYKLYQTGASVEEIKNESKRFLREEGVKAGAEGIRKSVSQAPLPDPDGLANSPQIAKAKSTQVEKQSTQVESSPPSPDPNRLANSPVEGEASNETIAESTTETNERITTIETTIARIDGNVKNSNADLKTIIERSSERTGGETGSFAENSRPLLQGMNPANATSGAGSANVSSNPAPLNSATNGPDFSLDQQLAQLDLLTSSAGVDQLTNPTFASPFRP